MITDQFSVKMESDGNPRRSGAIQLSDAGRQHCLFPVLDYIAKTVYKQSESMNELKTELQIVKDSVKELRELVDRLQDKESLNIGRFKVLHNY